MGPQHAIIEAQKGDTHMEHLTLDDATERFDHEPSDQSCAALLRASSTYFQDEMIGEDEFLRIVERVAEWLADE